MAEESTYDIIGHAAAVDHCRRWGASLQSFGHMLSSAKWVPEKDVKRMVNGGIGEMLEQFGALMGEHLEQARRKAEGDD